MSGELTGGIDTCGLSMVLIGKVWQRMQGTKRRSENRKPKVKGALSIGRKGGQVESKFMLSRSSSQEEQDFVLRRSVASQVPSGTLLSMFLDQGDNGKKVAVRLHQWTSKKEQEVAQKKFTTDDRASHMQVSSQGKGCGAHPQLRAPGNLFA